MFKWLNKEQKNELNQLPIFKNVEYFDIQVGWFEDIKKIGLEIQEYCDKNNNPYPEITQIMRVCTQSGKDTADVCTLQSICNLYAEKTKADVPQLPET